MNCLTPPISQAKNPRKVLRGQNATEAARITQIGTIRNPAGEQIHNGQGNETGKKSQGYDAKPFYEESLPRKKHDHGKGPDQNDIVQFFINRKCGYEPERQPPRPAGSFRSLFLDPYAQPQKAQHQGNRHGLQIVTSSNADTSEREERKN
jgi:hypothetical protein